MYEISQVFKAQGILFQGEMDVGPEIVDPYLARPGLFGCGLVVEKDHVGLDALLVKNAGGQTQDGVQVGGGHELLAHGLAGAAFEKNVVGHHHRSLTVGFKHGADVLDKVQLLVAGGAPEILAVNR